MEPPSVLQRLKKLLQKQLFVRLLLIYTVLAFVPFHKVVFEPGAIGLRFDWWLLPHPDEAPFLLRLSLSSWREIGVGMLDIRSGVRLFTIIVSSAAMILGLGGAALSKILPVVSIAVAGIASYVFLFSIVRRGPPAFIGSLLYMFSPLIFNTAIRGLLYFLFSYALLPLLLLTFLRSFRSKNPFPWVVASAILFAFLKDVVQIPALIILIALFINILLPVTQRRHVARCLRIATGMTLLSILFSAHFLAPALLNVKETAAHIRNVTSVALNPPKSPTFVDAFASGGGRYDFHAKFFPTEFAAWLPLAYILFIISAVTALLFSRFRRQAVIWITIFIVGVLLFKGTHPPLGVINEWLYKHVLFMSALQKPMYITVLTNIALSVLGTILIAYLYDGAKQNIFTARAKYIWKRITVALIILILATRIIPFLSGDLDGQIQMFDLHPDYIATIDQWNTDPQDGRRLALPALRYMRYNNSRFGGMDLIAIRSRSPIEEAVLTYSPISRFLVTLLHTANPTNVEDVLCAVRAHSVVVREDFTSTDSRGRFPQYNRTKWTQNEIETSPIWNYLTLSTQFADGKAAIYDIKNPCPMLQVSGGFTISTGNLSDFVDIADYWRSQRDRIGDVLFTAQQRIPANTDTLFAAAKRISIVQNNILDLTYLFLQSSQPIAIRNLTHFPRDGFASLSLWWAKDWHYAAVLDPSAVVSTGEQEGLSEVFIENEDEYELWVKTMKTQSGSSIVISFDEKEVSEINTRDDIVQGPVWTRVPLGMVTAGSHTLVLKTTGGENLIEKIILVPTSAIAQAQQRVDSLLRERDVTTSLTFNTRNPTEYERVFGPSMPTQGNRKVPLIIPRDGTYSVAVQAQDSSPPGVLRVNDTAFQVSGEKDQSDWQSLGNIDLTTGEHYITLPEHIDQIVLHSEGTESQPRAPSFAYQHNNTTRFTTAPHSAKTPYLLTVGEQFHPGWKAQTASTETQSKTAVSADNHMIVNGYANAWWIKPPEGKHSVVVYYGPQRLLNITLLVSALILVVCIIIITWQKREYIWPRLQRVKGGPIPVIVGIVLIVVFAGWRIASQWDHPASYDALQEPAVQETGLGEEG